MTDQYNPVSQEYYTQPAAPVAPAPVAPAPVAPAPVAPAPAPVVDPSITVLSSGVKVRIQPVPQRFAQDGMLRIFRNAKLDKKGNLVTDSTDIQSQLKLAQEVSNHNRTLLTYGVTLVGNIEDYYSVGVNPNWLKRLLRSGIDVSGIDLNDQDDIVFLFLQYEAFVSDTDWAVLNEKAVSTQ